MARYFFDSSALAKLYQAEAGSANVEAIFREANGTIIISRLTVVEINSIFSRRVRMGDLNVADATLLRNHFLNDVATKAFTVVGIIDQHFSEAERLLIQYAGTKSLRTLDALQLAVALDVFRRGSLNSVLAADKTLIEVAAAEGLPVTNPET
jgi:predicted nucleic acid-binding protein